MGLAHPIELNESGKIGMNLSEVLERDAVYVAPCLLGMMLVSDVGGSVVVARITEVEAYTREDEASHSYRGETVRNRSMFKGGGTLYVYRSYGVHWCANVVTGKVGSGDAVLLRGGEILDGIECAMSRRGRSTNLADGPGKFTQAMGIGGIHDGLDLRGGAPIRLVDGEVPAKTRCTTRIGISKARDKCWRFLIEEG